MEEPGIGFWLLRIAASIAGVLLIYAAAFTYPQEREGLHSKLEDWWLQLYEAGDEALKRHVAFIQKTAATAKNGFDWLFGPPLSTRFFVVSGFLSMGTFAIGMLSFGDYGWAVPTGIVLFTIGIFVFALLIGRQQDKLAAELEETSLKTLRKYTDEPFNLPRVDVHKALFADKPGFGRSAQQWRDLQDALSDDPLYRQKKPWWQDAISSDNTSNFIMPVVIATLAFSSTGLVFAGAQDKGVGEGVFMMSLITAFICDAVCVLITVFFLEKISKAKSAVAAATYFLIDAVVAGAMLAVPWMLFAWVADQDTTFAHYLVFVAAANLSTAIPSVVFLLVAVTTLAHRLFWPILLRPCYNLIHAEKITKPKTLGLAGLACFSVWLEVPESYRASLKEFLNLL
ncbi:hypothetical protein [Pelagibius sp. Alg239-R121]|uniref:hypothetical protein n=1 Tax=Pelagibius sp. Alg239-R121 TaxID=2993448 RepID=UPI0024A61ED3|nr:hypothetical protein [Pelagibius sp. Alg239-R121]